MVTSGSVADQQALIAAGCTALLPNAGGIASTQPGTAAQGPSFRETAP